MLILASTSPFRRALLESAGLAFTAEAPEVDEWAPEGAHPKHLARALAQKKAQAVARRHPADLVIGSDQTVELDGHVLRKPTTRDEARAQLQALAGHSHALHTAVAIARVAPRVRRIGVESVRMAMRALTPAEIEAYLDAGEWRGCAGGYRIEGRGIQLFESVRGEHSAIVGLPLMRLFRMLRELGADPLTDPALARPAPPPAH